MAHGERVKRFVPAVLILLHVGGLASWAASPVGLGVSLTVKPSSETVGANTVKAVITDLENQEVLSAPTIHLPKGEWGEVKSETMGEEVLRFSVMISDDESETSYKAELTRDGEVVASQQASITLER
jgi:hypothetical protein